MIKNCRHQHRDVTTASTVRLAICQPTRRPVLKTWRAETKWGSATITGRIGQRHADFIECSRAVAEEQGLDGAERFCCIVDPNKLRTAMSEGRARMEWRQMRGLADDLRTCSISDLRIAARPTFGVVTAGILDSVVFEGIGQAPTRPCARLGGVVARGGEGRDLWKVSFSEPWTALIGADLPISYRGHLPHIVALRHGVSQAVARFMLSHNPGATYLLPEVLRIVGVAPSVLHHRRREINEDIEGLAAAGVWVSGDEVSTAGPNLNPGGPNLNPGGPKLNPGFPKLNPGSYRLIGP